jgi:DNA primase
LGSLLQYPLGPRGAAYAAARGLADVAGSLKLGEVSATPKPEHRRYAGRLVIPSFSARGTVCDVALRCMAEHDCGAEGCPKYLFMPGINKRLYGLDDVASAGTEIHITEGHPDRMSLKACGLHAVGVAGVNAWKAYHARLMAGFERVYYWQQSDDKGQSEGLGERIRASLGGVGVMMVQAPPGHDVNSWLVAEGKEAVLSLIPSDDDTEGESTDEREQHFDDDDGVVIPF